MKKACLRIAALAVILCLLLCGCWLPGSYGTAFEDMVYTRPNLPELNNCADRCVELSQGETTLEELWPEVEEFFILYSDFYTQYLLAYVHYCQDMTDLYWVDEYNYCEEKIPQAETTRDRLLHELAKSPFREALEAEDYFGEDYFDDYDGESIWTDQFQSLKEGEAQLLTQYYEICQDGTGMDGYTEEYLDSCGSRLEELYIRLVAQRQQLAQAAGYDSYPEYAFAQMYYRDYTVEDSTALCQQIRQELTPLYLELAESGFWDLGVYAASQRDTYQYVRTAATNMGGQIAGAFRLMSQYGLYDISYREHKLDSAFEVYFYDYEQPYIFLFPTGTEMDHLSFAHEFGHFCSDYVSFGSIAGIDTAEVFSQGMEYLSLFYADASPELAQTQLADGLCTYVEQAAYSAFEQQVYALSTDELTVETVRRIFEATCSDFGLDQWELDSRSYVNVSHFFTQPLYVISYVVSNDAAFQLYQLERQEKGAGLSVYTATLGTTEEAFLPYLEEAGLDSPFSEGRIQQVKQTFQEALF